MDKLVGSIKKMMVKSLDDKGNDCIWPLDKYSWRKINDGIKLLRT